MSSVGQAKLMEDRHDFSVMIAAVGNHINHDRSNMALYVSPTLQGVRHH